MSIATTDAVKLLLALVLGASLGIEREIRNKGAGLRTITLICIGASLFTIFSIRLEGAGRIAANIVTGIGFLGAGVILHENNRIKGLTTAADVWVSAAIGMGVGGGYYALSVFSTLVVLAMMLLFTKFERRVDRRWEAREYRLALTCDTQKAEQMEDMARQCDLQISVLSRMKINDQLVCNWDIIGTSKNHDCFVKMAMDDPDVKQIEW